ncbi:MAG: hypothetical protein OFPI_08540 [Osedax symbiont Rs2]|nr:MAG: hypothetical protein OFPI_08540 [Osedax symbiont Rs2]
MKQNTSDALDAALSNLENNRNKTIQPKQSAIAKPNATQMPPRSARADNSSTIETAKTVQQQLSENSLQQSQFNYSEQIFSELNCNRSQLEERNLVNCEFHQCDFSFASLAFVQAQNCKFYDCNFNQANLKESLFSHCSFYDSERQLGCNFYAADLTNAKFTKSDLSLSVFERSSMFGIEIVDCQAQGSSFKMADFGSLIRRNKPFYSAFINNSNFRYADFSGCQLVKCDLAGSVFTSGNFLDADLQGCTLCAADLSAIQFETLSLAGADLRNAQLTGLDIRKLDLQGVKINDWQQSVLLESLGVVVFPD